MRPWYVNQSARLILHAKREYYRGFPIMSDGEYDALEELLRHVDPDHPVLDMVGWDESYEKEAESW